MKNRMLTAALVLITLSGCTSLTAPVNTRLYTPSVVCTEGYRCPFGLPADSLYIRNRLPYGCPDLNTRWVAFDSNKDIGFCRSLFFKDRGNADVRHEKPYDVIVRKAP